MWSLGSVDDVHASSSSTRPNGASKAARRHEIARREVVVSCLLLLLVGVTGALLVRQSSPAPIDQWLSKFVPYHHAAQLSPITDLRQPVFVVLGAAGLSALTVRRDRARALTCLIGPPLALFTCEMVVKPLVGRTLGPPDVYSFPSGSTAGAAALGTAAVLVSPIRWRMVTAVFTTAYAMAMAMAVVALKWHFPTDALAGFLYGVGVVLLIDGLSVLLPAWSSRLVRGCRTLATGSATQGRSP